MSEVGVEAATEPAIQEPAPAAVVAAAAPEPEVPEAARAPALQVIETPVAPATPDPAEIVQPPAKPRQGWWRRNV